MKFLCIMMPLLNVRKNEIKSQSIYLNWIETIMIISSPITYTSYQTEQWQQTAWLVYRQPKVEWALFCLSNTKKTSSKSQQSKIISMHDSNSLSASIHSNTKLTKKLLELSRVRYRIAGNKYNWDQWRATGFSIFFKPQFVSCCLLQCFAT